VVGVSRDSQKTNDDFGKSLDLPFALVGDQKGAISRAFKVRWPVIGLARRVTYVVGKDRKIRLAFHSETDVSAHVREAAKVCAEL
jgi:peroxiredoxin